jgi:DNA polymerase II small subunit/DNA polymerase delta subunit B
MKIDQRGILDDEVFTYRATKDNKVFISWHGKQVTILSGSKADEFISKISGADEKESQLIMAKATGHFKHGNEKANKRQ